MIIQAQSPLPRAVAQPIAAEPDPWAGYEDTLELGKQAPAPQDKPVQNDFSAAAARLVQRENSLIAQAKAAADKKAADQKAAEKKAAG